ncbi:MAG: glycoside hydrolase family 99-like domain-containing protein [bacterium]
MLKTNLTKLFLILSLIFIVSLSGCNMINDDYYEDNIYQGKVTIDGFSEENNASELKLLLEGDKITPRKVEDFKIQNGEIIANLANLKGEVFITPVCNGYTFSPSSEKVNSSNNEVNFTAHFNNNEIKNRVMTFYYPWYRTENYSGRWFHWEKVDKENKEIGNSTNYPELGPYDSTNPEVVETHLKQAKEVGIDTLILSWWGPGSPSDNAVDLILDKALEYDISITLYYEENQKETSQDRIDKGVEDFKYILEEYTYHPAYLRVNGNPVLFTYIRVMDQVSKNEWRDIFETVKNDKGEEFEIISGELTEESASLFDGFHRYNYAAQMESLIDEGNSADEIEDIKRNEFEGWIKDLGDPYDIISALTVTPGYDDTKIREPGIVVPRKKGDIYKALWNAAIDADPDWILITSFNEWHEGTEIEPSFEYGEKYLKITKEKINEFK